MKRSRFDEISQDIRMMDCVKEPLDRAIEQAKKEDSFEVVLDYHQALYIAERLQMGRDKQARRLNYNQKVLMRMESGEYLNDDARHFANKADAALTDDSELV